LAENLPLSGGTNELALTATDAAGNVVTTNISIIQSPLQLIMNDVPGDQLWNPTVNVTGAISDPADYTVWVNGVKARMDGSGAWEADQVPTTPGGTAVFEVRAIPNTDNGGNGTGGSGGNSASYADPGNPDSPQAQDTQSQTDKPMRLYVESYSYNEHAEVHPSGSGYNNDNVQTYSFQVDDAETWSLNWADGQGGGGNYDRSGDYHLTGTLGNDAYSSTADDFRQWPKTSWPNLVDGTETYQFTWLYDGVPGSDSGSVEAGPPSVDWSGYDDTWPEIRFEHCQKQDSGSGSATEYDPSSGGYNTAQDNVVWTRTADTVMKLFTGGKAGSGRQNLFVLNASGRRPLWTGVKLNLLIGELWTEWELPPLLGPWTSIDPRQITIAGKALDTNGTAYFAWPDGVTRDVTPRTGYDYYTFAQPSVGKYLSHFEVFVRQPWPDIYDRDWTPPDPPPPGYPLVAGIDAGHAWWKLSSDAPVEAVNKFTGTDCTQWLNTEVGYGPVDTSYDWWSWIWDPGSSSVSTGPGELETDNGYPSVHRTYGIGFPGLIAGLNHTEHLNQYPGTWDSRWHNCVHETRITGGAAGVKLPDDWDPEDFGFDLPPDDP
jgi:hypothetical protein